VQPAQLLTAQDLVPIKDTWVVITQDNLISRTLTARLPRLAGRKPPKLVVGARTRDTLYVFDAQGRGAATAVHTLAECDDPNQGKTISSAAALPSDASAVAAICLPPEATASQQGHGYLLFGTKLGMLKKTPLMALPGPSAKPFMAVKLGKGDALSWVHYTGGNDDILMVSSSGQAIRFSENSVRPMGLAAAGVQGMRIDDPETSIVGIDIARPGHDLLLLAEDGQVKRSALSQFGKQGRNGKGVLAWRSEDKLRLVGAAMGRPDDRAAIRLARAAARSIRFSDAPRRARTGPGKMLFPIGENDRVLSLTAIIARPLIPKPKKKTTKRRKPASAKPKS
jgi:DNA gyrase subunit A